MGADVLHEMQVLVREAARPGAEPGESVKAAIRRAATRLGLSYSRTHQHWYGRARRVDAAEWLIAQEAGLRLRRARAEALRAELARLEGDHDLVAALHGGHRLLDRGPMA